MSVFLKQFFDFVCAAMGLVFLSLLMVWIDWRIRRKDGGAVFYLPISALGHFR